MRAWILDEYLAMCSSFSLVPTWKDFNTFVYFSRYREFLRVCDLHDWKPTQRNYRGYIATLPKRRYWVTNKIQVEVYCA